MEGRRELTIDLTPGKKIYFASDQHFGAPNAADSKLREQKFVKWLDEIAPHAQALFLLGDLFDFWFEYKSVVPKGFVRVLGKLAELKDRGIDIYFFTGNHDVWMRDYFTQELHIPVYHQYQIFNISGKKFLIGHGDGLGPGDKGYKRLKKIFRNPLAQWLYRWLHPDVGLPLGGYLSRKNKLISGDEDVKFLGAENEWLVQYAKHKLQIEPIDYFIFGHRHLPLDLSVENAQYINLGDWIAYYTYAVYNGQSIELKAFNEGCTDKPSSLLTKEK